MENKTSYSLTPNNEESYNTGSYIIKSSDVSLKTCELTSSDDKQTTHTNTYIYTEPEKTHLHNNKKHINKTFLFYTIITIAYIVLILFNSFYDNNVEEHLNIVKYDKETIISQKDPNKYALTSHVFGYDAYQTYQSVLKHIKGTRAKDEKARYIQSLKISAIKKKMLFKSEYPADTSYDYEIVEYILSLNIPKSEKDKIARAVGFEE